jgi:hypothetical protein
MSTRIKSMTKLSGAAEAEIIGTFIAASVKINYRCSAVVTVTKETMN